MTNALAPPSQNALAQEGYRPQQHRRGRTYGTRHGGGPSLRDAPYGLREDGTPKGKGFLGLIPTGKGNEVMSEKSMSIEIDGRKTLIPLVIPGLTEDELNMLKTTK